MVHGLSRPIVIIRGVAMPTIRNYLLLSGCRGYHAPSNKPNKEPVIPSVRVKLIHVLPLPPRYNVKVTVQLAGNNKLSGLVLIE